MPSGKDRSKEDTWKESDLKKALKDDRGKSKDESRKSKESSSSRRSEDKRERKDKDDDRKRRGHDELANGDHRKADKDRDRDRGRDKDREKERGHDRGKERDRGKEQERDKERDRDKDREKDRGRERDREREKERDRTKDRDREREGDRERRKRDEGRYKERSRDKGEDYDKDKDRLKGGERRTEERGGHADRSKDRRSKEHDRSREMRKEKESVDRDHDRERRRERDTAFEKTKDEERKRDSRERHGERDRSRERTKERSYEDKERDRRREKQKEGRGEVDRTERSRDRDRSKERRRDDKDREKDRERRKEKERDRLDKENRDSDKDERKRSDRREKESRDLDRRKDRSKNEESSSREKEDKIKRREKEMIEALKKEEELKRNPLKFRSDTMEEADTIDEDVEQQRKTSSQRLPSSGTVEEVHEEENGGYDYDDDDFEDYDDDFEDDADEEEDNEEASLDVQDHARMQELLQAIHAENQDARTSSSEGKEERKEHSEPINREKVRATTASHGRINFVAAKQKQITNQVASRTRKRGQELMHLIDLDVAVFDIFELPPLNEYELYIKNFGRSDTKQAYVQYNEDNVEKEVQTEDIETRTKWTQNPASDAAGFGDEEDDQEKDLSTLAEKANIDSLRLSKFLQRAAQTCLIILEENVSEQTNTQFKDRKDMSCSDGFIQLATKHSYLEGRQVTCVHISPVQTYFLLTAYGAVKEQGKTASKAQPNIQEKGIVCFWNTNEPSEPQKVLICESTPRCCCLSPSKATLAFAGLEDGSVVAWDLRESSLMHSFSKISVGDSEVFLRPPTFSTAGVLRKDESHLSPVVSILPVVMPGDSARASGGTSVTSDDMSGLSFQLASLEENAAINLWVVVELDRANDAGSESDLGLSPGGKIKLIRSSSISLHSPFRDFRSEMNLQSLIMRFLPHDPNHIYVGTDGGYILHCERHGSRAPPKAHRPAIENLVNVSAVDLSPWQLPCMLAGTEDGNLWLFNLKNEIPLFSWSTNGNGIISVQWSRSRPSVFYVLDINSNLHIWDLLKSDQGPVAVEKFKHGRVVCFELSNDYSASGIGIPGRNPELVLVFESGTVEIHKLSKAFTSASGEELDSFATYLDTVM
ncbi:cytoplasmic dynein 2 intermediate chain 1 isoform X2 [Pocillopora verrucosa]|uniref:cytoplasmic dynein 2 intermediate chain 1 isoform X2 n=1 Tax=Pocillopora verrucosa TaxID=203993 RepID=UPI0033403797